MFGSSKLVVGLDVGSYAVKAVALQPSGDRLTLQGYAQVRIGSQEPVEVIRKVIDQLGIKPKRMVTSVSGRSVIVRQVETPRLPTDELKAHIAYEADKYIPFGSEEVIIDCQTLPDRDEAKANNMQVLLVAVRR
jgi:type IV pilus assembly protein PilM